MHLFDSLRFRAQAGIDGGLVIATTLRLHEQRSRARRSPV
jgi:hypothetical protein